MGIQAEESTRTMTMTMNTREDDCSGLCWLILLCIDFTLCSTLEPDQVQYVGNSWVCQ